MKVAIVYDRVNKWGGAERVLLALHKIFPEAPLYTSVYSPGHAKWAQKFPKVIASKLSKIPILRNKHELLGTLMPIVFESFSFKGYDLAISITSEAAKGIITDGRTKHICYCLTPTRYLWSHYADYFQSPALKGVSWPFVSYLRRWDKIVAQRPDVMIAISTEVQSRIKKYYGRDSMVIYPPLTNFQSGFNSNIKHISNFYLLVSRLVPYKRADLVVEAFNELGLPLVVIGSGSQEQKLKKLAKKNIIFLGQVSDTKLASYYKNTKALIFPQEEDFGLVAVEAQSFGVPVIAFKKGGSLDVVREGVNGIFFNNQTKKDVVEAVKRFARIKFDKNVIIESTKRFSQKKFEEEFLKLVKNNVG